MRRIKIIQINIFKGKYLNDLCDFLKQEDPDFITAQEVTTSEFNLFKDKTANLFELLKSELGMEGVHFGDLRLKGAKEATFGNAVFSKHKIISSDRLILKTFRPITLDELDGKSAREFRPQIPRHLLEAVVDFFGREIHVFSWHGAWTAPPADTPQTLRQAKLVADYLEALGDPFILGGDLNNVPQSRTVDLINKVSNNLMLQSSTHQTTHPVIHRIVPKGFLIDYIFASKHFRLVNIKVGNVTVSDHLPVIAELKI